MSFLLDINAVQPLLVYMLSRFSSDLSIPLNWLDSPQTLSLDSTLQSLSLWEYELESYHLGKEVASQFQENPLLPGIILTDRGNFAGMISRRRFLEHLSRPYGQELFLQRPLASLYRFAQTDILKFPSTTKIVEAARESLHRRAELLYEPVVVEMASRDYRLLDVHQLLVAHAQIQELTTQLLNQTRQKLEGANHELQRLATLDGLTQLANRRRFDEYLDGEWRRSLREQTPLTMILCDVDFFKLYNDTYGHLAGDDCLRQVARAIQNAPKRSMDLVARYGGEEFAAILPNTDAAGGFHVAEAIRKNLKALQLVHGNSPIAEFVTISLGVACMIPSRENSPTQLIAATDLALYQAKEEGRDRTNINLCC